MRALVIAEYRLYTRRRVTRVALAVTVLLVLVLAAFRFLTSSSDVASAVLEAQQTADELTALTSTAVDASQTYVEPRYVFASAAPYDLAGASVGVALTLLVAGATSTGGDWRTRANRMTFAGSASRAVPAMIRVIVWGGIGAAAAACVLALGALLLLGVAAARGSVAGVDTVTVLLILLRGVLLSALGAVGGAALGSMVRSDVVVVVGVLAYVLGLELLAPALLASSGWTSPGAHLISLVISDGAPQRVAAPCDVPLCADIVAAGWGPAAAYGIATLGVVSLLAGVWRAARLPVWS